MDCEVPYEWHGLNGAEEGGHIAALGAQKMCWSGGDVSPYH